MQVSGLIAPDLLACQDIVMLDPVNSLPGQGYALKTDLAAAMRVMDMDLDMDVDKIALVSIDKTDKGKARLGDLMGKQLLAQMVNEMKLS